MTRAPWIVSAAAAGGTVTAVLALSLPPHAARVPGTPWRPSRTVVAGAFHVHTNRSDGAGSVDDVAAAAARARLQFVVVTDHGDGTREPDPPSYRSGVLVLDGVEISTSGGHYAVAGLPRAPYPIAGEPRDVVEDVTRQGGFGVVAHGDSPKSELQWRDWSVALDALEWLSLDSAWRARTRAHLAQAFVGYFFRPPEALGSLLSRPAALLRRWDDMGSARRVATLASTDCHGQMPSYEACFQTMTTRVELDGRLSGNPDVDGRAVVSALRAGHHYTSVDALAVPEGFEFTARRRDAIAQEGDGVPHGEAVTLEAHVGGAPDARVVLLRDGVSVAETSGSRLTAIVDGARATYRVEVRWPFAPGEPPVPWILSNPIYVGEPHPSTALVMPPARNRAELAHWRAEHDDRSTATFARGEESGHPLTFRYALGPGPPSNQFAALVAWLGTDLPAYDRITFTAQATHPMRVGVQLRPSGRDNPPRWQRSVYLDRTPRTVTVSFDDLHAVPRTVTGPVPLPTIDALLFIMDTTHTRPGTTGEIVFEEMGLERSRER